MDIHTLKAEIRQTFEALTEQMEIIGQHQGKIPQIEIDLIMDNIRELYAAFKDLDRLNSPWAGGREAVQVPAPAAPVKEDVPQEEAPVREFAFREKIVLESILEEADLPEIPAPHVQYAPPATHAEEQPVQPIQPPYITEQPPVQPAQPQYIQEQQPVQPQQPQYIQEQPPVQEAPSVVQRTPFRPSGDLFSVQGGHSISDSYKDEKKTLNDRLQNDAGARSIGSRLSQNQISDIKTAIGINEKFQFINELFGGNMQEYTNGMNQLNQFTRFDEATAYIDVLKFKYNWDMNADGYRKLMEILRRRYPS